MALRPDQSLRLTMVGHASLIIETADAVIYSDPVLHDPHHEGLFEITPPRSLDFEALPRPTHIFISHQHFDHFDLRSLADFDRDTPVIVPDDPLVVGGIEGLGFRSVQRISDWSRIDIGRTRLCFTPSKLRLPEHGMIVETPGARMWNQVDTMVPREAVLRVREEIGPIDLLIAPWQPLLDLVTQTNLDSSFPTKRYADLLVAAARVRARITVPGACGFRFAAPWDWQNHTCFPVTLERCVRDLERMRVTPEQQIVPLQPGDRIALGGGEPERDESPAIVRNRPPPADQLEFDPTHSRYLGTAVFEPDAASDAGALVSEIEERLEAALRADEPLAASYAEWEVVHQLTLVSGSTRTVFHADLRSGSPVFGPGPHPLANAHSIVALSEMAQLAAGRCSWDRLIASGAYRHHHSFFRLTPQGVETPKAGLPDPLWVAFLYSDALAAKMEAEVARYRDRPPVLRSRQKEET